MHSPDVTGENRARFEEAGRFVHQIFAPDCGTSSTAVWRKICWKWLFHYVPAFLFWTNALAGSLVAVSIATHFPHHATVSTYVSPLAWGICILTFLIIFACRRNWTALSQPFFILLSPFIFLLTVILSVPEFLWNAGSLLRRSLVLSTAIVSLSLLPILLVTEIRASDEIVLASSAIIRNILLGSILLFALRWAARPLRWTSTVLEIIDRLTNWLIGDKSRLRTPSKKPEKPDEVTAFISRCELWIGKVEGWIEADKGSSRRFVTILFLTIGGAVTMLDVSNFAVTYHTLSTLVPGSFSEAYHASLSTWGSYLSFSFCVFTGGSYLQYLPSNSLAHFAVSLQVTSSIVILTIFLLQFTLNAENAVTEAKDLVRRQIGTERLRIQRLRQHMLEMAASKSVVNTESPRSLPAEVLVENAADVQAQAIKAPSRNPPPQTEPS